MVLNQDATVSGVGNIAAGIAIRIQLDSVAKVASSGSTPAAPNQSAWGNDNLNPPNTFYTVTGYTAQGQIAWGPNNQQVKGSSPFDVGTWVPNLVISWVPSIQGVALQTNGVSNTIQTLLNLESLDSSVTITDNGGGNVNLSVAPAAGLSLKVNGTPNASQSVLNLESTDASVTITDLGSGNINLQASGFSFGTSGQGWFLGAQSFAPISDDAGHAQNENGTVYAVQLMLTAKWTISHLAAFVVTGNGSSQNFTAGIYNATGTVKLIDAGAGAFDTTASQKYRSVTLGATVTLSPGLYWFAFSSNGTSGGSVLCHALETWFTQMVNGVDFIAGQVLPTRYGTAANGLVANTLPATLGSITPLDHTGAINIPVVLFAV
jgi:hypothetical protein